MRSPTQPPVAGRIVHALMRSETSTNQFTTQKGELVLADGAKDNWD